MVEMIEKVQSDGIEVEVFKNPRGAFCVRVLDTDSGLFCGTIMMFKELAKALAYAQKCLA